MKGKILWLSPPDYMPNAENEMTAWRKYFEEYKEWEVTTNKEDIFDIVFFGSDSMLDEELLNDDSIYKILYFWGYPWFRLIDARNINNYRKMMNFINKCDMILTPSLVTFYQLCDFGVRSMVCYAGLDNRLIDSVPDQQKENQVCACSRLVPHKAFDCLLSAVSKLKQDIKVVLIGEGEEKGRLINLAKDLGVELEIKRLNHYDKIKEFKKSLCIVAPSIYEGFGMVPIEALFAGVPVIARDIPVAREILKEDAFYFANENDLAQILEYAIANPMPNKVHFVKNFYTLDNACKRLNIVFKEAIEKQKERTNPYWERHWRGKYVIPELKGKVLDAGCGMGIFSVLIAKAGHDVVAVDKNRRHVEAAKRLARRHRLSIKAMEADLNDLPFENNEFDTTHIGEVIEHFKLDDLSKVMNEVIRTTKKRVVGTTPIGYHHYCEDHKIIWDDKSIEQFLNNLDNVNLIKLEKIAEEEREASCYLFVLEKK